MIAAEATATELVPGDPAAPEQLAVELDRYAHGADEAAMWLRGLDREGIWVGQAAEAFRARLAELPARLSRGTQAFGESARALRYYAGELRAAQATAAQVAELAAQGHRESAAYQQQVADYQAAVAAGVPAGPAPPPVDPGAELMAQAERMLADARQRVDQAGQYASHVLEAAGEQAPDRSSFWSQAWHQLSEFGQGFGESSWGLLKFVYRSSPVYAAVDASAFVQHWTAMGKGVAHGVQHPVAFAKATADWETFKKNKARWLGHLGPEALLGVASGGGAVAARGIRSGKTLTKLDNIRSMRAKPGAGRHGGGPGQPWSGEGGVHLTPEQNEAADRFLANARRAEPQITRDVISIAEDVGGSRMRALESRLKDEDSFKRKLAGQLSDADLQSSPDNALAKMKDSVRYTMELPENSYADGVDKAVQELQRRGYENVTWKNSWGGEGYQGLNSTWRDPQSGQVFELQFHTRESFEAKTATHELYEKQRLPDTSPEEHARLDSEQRETFDRVPVPDGARDLQPPG